MLKCEPLDMVSGINEIFSKFLEHWKTGSGLAMAFQMLLVQNITVWFEKPLNMIQNGCLKNIFLIASFSLVT